MDDWHAPRYCGCAPAWASYYGNDRHADVTIVSRDGCEIKAHKIVLSLGSPYFDKALDPAHNFKEAQSSTVCLDDEDPAIVKAVLQFLYTGDYSVPPSASPSTDGTINADQAQDLHASLKFHAALHAAAGYFLVPPLAGLSFSRFQTLVSEHWDNPAADFAGVVRFVYDILPPVETCVEAVPTTTENSNNDTAAFTISRACSPSASPSTSPYSSSSPTPPPDHDRNRNALRTLVATLSATHFAVLITRPSFSATMDAVGAFGRELSCLLFARTKALEKSFGARHFLCPYCVERYCVPPDSCEVLQCRFCRRGGKVLALVADG